MTEAVQALRGVAQLGVPWHRKSDMLAKRTTFLGYAAAARRAWADRVVALGLGAAAVLLSAAPAAAGFDTTMTDAALLKPLIGYCRNCITTTNNVAAACDMTTESVNSTNFGFPGWSGRDTENFRFVNDDSFSGLGPHMVSGSKNTTDDAIAGALPSGIATIPYDSAPSENGDLVLYIKIKLANPTIDIGGTRTCNGWNGIYERSLDQDYIYYVDLRTNYLIGEPILNVSTLLSVRAMLSDAFYIARVLNIDPNQSTNWDLAANTRTIFTKILGAAGLALLSAMLVVFGLMFLPRSRRISGSGHRST